MKTYVEYLSEVLFEAIQLSELTFEKLSNLELKNGVFIVDQGNIKISLMHKFEPMSILNTVNIFEKAYEFIVIDPFGIIMYEGTAEDVISYANGFYSNDDE